MNEKINQISKEMRTQDNRATQYPLFVIMDKVRELAPQGWGDGILRRDDNEYDEMCERCKKLEDNGEILPDYCDDCDENCFWEYVEVDRPQLDYGVFFTAKACDECIAANHYHFKNPRSYGIGAFRNYEMQTVQQHLLSLTGEIPNHYS